MRTVHIKGWAENLDLLEELSDNYDIPHDFPFNEDGEESFKAFIRIYYSDKESTLDEAIVGFVEKMSGSIRMIGSEYGYSEYTIEGFSVRSAKLGGHDLNRILETYKKGKKYVHILIDEIE